MSKQLAWLNGESEACSLLLQRSLKQHAEERGLLTRLDDGFAGMHAEKREMVAQAADVINGERCACEQNS